MFITDDNICIENLSVLRARSIPGFFDIKPRALDALSFRIKGDAEFESNGKKVSSHPGDIFFMPKNTHYKAEYTDGEIIVFHFISSEKASDMENFSGIFSDKIYTLFLKAELMWQKKNPGYRHFCLATFYEILGHLSSIRPNQQYPKNFAGAISEINNCFSNHNLCISEICRKYSISQTYFRQLFQKHYSKTPVDYITELRLEYAKNLLFSEYTVEQASNASGFSDPKYFARVVKKKFGCTPTQLKSTAGNRNILKG